jgi:hypothetical protein
MSLASVIVVALHIPFLLKEARGVSPPVEIAGKLGPSLVEFGGKLGASIVGFGGKLRPSPAPKLPPTFALCRRCLLGLEVGLGLVVFGAARAAIFGTLCDVRLSVSKAQYAALHYPLHPLRC